VTSPLSPRMCAWLRGKTCLSVRAITRYADDREDAPEHLFSPLAQSLLQRLFFVLPDDERRFRIGFRVGVRSGVRVFLAEKRLLQGCLGGMHKRTVLLPRGGCVRGVFFRGKKRLNGE
jgi:hypothetical protein